MKVTISNLQQAFVFKHSLAENDSFQTIESKAAIRKKSDSLCTLRVTLSKKQLKKLHVITTLILVVTFGIAKCFQAFRENLRTLKTKEQSIHVYVKKSCPAILKKYLQDLLGIKKDLFFKELLKNLDQSKNQEAFEKLKVLSEKSQKTDLNEILEILITLPDEELEKLKTILSHQEPPLEYANLIEIAEATRKMIILDIPYKNLEERFQKEKFIALKAVGIDVSYYVDLPIEFKRDKEILFTLARKNAKGSVRGSWSHPANVLPEDINDNEEIMLELIRIHPGYCVRISDNLEDNKKFAIEVLKIDKDCLRLFSERLQKDPELVQMAK